MLDKMKNTLLVALLVSAVSGYSAVSQQVVVTSKVNPSSSVGKLELNVVFDSRGDAGLKLTDPKNPNNHVYNHVIKTLARYGEILPGLETGPARQSSRLLADSIKDGVTVRSSNGDQPTLIKNFQKIHDMLTPYRQELEQRDQSELIENYKSVPVVYFKIKVNKEIDRFLLCVSLDYSANVSGALRLPLFVEKIMANECASGKGGLDFVTKLSTLEKDTVQFAPPGTNLDDFPEYWLPQEFSNSFYLCENLEKLDSMAAAGWMDPNLSVNDQKNECRKFLQVQVVSNLENVLKNGMNSSVLKKNISPYYRSILEEMLKVSGANYTISAKDLEAQVSSEIKSTLTVINGFTNSEVQTTDFNTQEFTIALQKLITDPNSLLAILLSSPEGYSSSLRDELAKIDDSTVVDSYMNRLKSALAVSCNLAQMIPTCLYQGAAKISSSQSKVTVQSGVEASQIWSGFLLHSNRKNQ